MWFEPMKQFEKRHRTVLSNLTAFCRASYYCSRGFHMPKKAKGGELIKRKPVERFNQWKSWRVGSWANLLVLDEFASLFGVSKFLLIKMLGFCEFHLPERTKFHGTMLLYEDSIANPQTRLGPFFAYTLAVIVSYCILYQSQDRAITFYDWVRVLDQQWSRTANMLIWVLANRYVT